MYETADRLIALLDKKLRRYINRLDVTGFSELNALVIQRETTELIKKLLADNKEAFRKIAEDAIAEAAADIENLTGEEAKRVKADDKYVDEILNQYNEITGYLYYPEADRKRARLSEALIVALMLLDRSKYHDNLRKFANLWHTQTVQYEITVTDETRVDIFDRNGIKKVKWNAEHDEKTCKVCRERDGKIYPIDKVPAKPHYNCRCWLTPVK
jgi:SPP1 gp7 family putative phage head morphogenesis protein